MLCTWIPVCPGRATYHVERQTRPGLTVEDEVCDKHVEEARRHGYRISERTEPAPPGRDPADRTAR